MKILYLAVGIEVDNRYSSGVFKKMLGQSEGFKKLGHTCEIMLISRRHFYVLAGEKVLFEDVFSKERFARLLCENRYDLVYARNGGVSHGFKECIRVINSCRCKCVVEIPTYPILGEQVGKAHDRAKHHQYFLALRSFIGGVYLQYIALAELGRKVDRFIIISSSAQIGKTECISIENGIDISQIRPIDYSHRAPHPFTMIAVANINYWHGFDRVICGISKYVEMTGNRDIRFVVVGDGNYLQTLKSIVVENKLSDIVCFTGKLFGEDLAHVFSEADVAVGSLGLHRKKLYQSSTLKSREYCARGIPYVISEGEEWPLALKEYIYMTEANDNPLEICSIIEWYEALSSNIGKHAQAMREYAEQHFQWPQQMKKAIDGLYNK